MMSSSVPLFPQRTILVIWISYPCSQIDCRCSNLIFQEYEHFHRYCKCKCRLIGAFALSSDCQLASLDLKFGFLTEKKIFSFHFPQCPSSPCFSARIVLSVEGSEALKRSTWYFHRNHFWDWHSYYPHCQFGFYFHFRL